MYPTIDNVRPTSVRNEIKTPDLLNKQRSRTINYLMLGFIGALAVFVPIYPAMLIVVALVAGLYFLIFPVSFLWALMLFHLVLYVPHIGPFLDEYRVHIGAVSVHLNDFFFLGLFVLVAFGALVSREKRQVIWHPIGRWVTLFLFYTVLQMGVAFLRKVPPDSIIREGSGYLSCAFFLFVIMYLGTKDISRVMKFGYRIWLLVPMIQVYMLAAGLTWQTDTGSVRTYFIGPNIFFLAVITYKLLADDFNLRNALVIVYMLCGMAMTQYRSAFVALMALILIAGHYYLKEADIKKAFFYPFSVGIFGFILLLGLIAAKPQYMQKTYDRYLASYKSSATVEARVSMWNAGIKTFKNNPFIGIGIGNPIFSDVNDKFSNEWNPHNFAVRLLAKTGLIGLILALVLMAAFYKHILLFEVKDVHQERVRKFGIGFFITLLIVHLMNTTFVAERTAFVTWLFMGMVMVQLRSEETR
ncbi:MAG: O-antigen ligase family protein [Deltaproteobacteria bacterium]|nr:O-antigen ligase family protein [Deltaproteobacteria bacterium]